MTAPYDELARFLAYAFQATGRRALTGADFVRIHSFERRWAAPPLVRSAVAAGLQRGLLSASGQDAFAPGFDLEGVRLGFDYSPDPGRLETEVATAAPAGDPGKPLPLFRRIVRRVASKTNQSDAEVVAAVNQQQSSVGGLWTAEVAALVYARLQGVDVADLVAEARRQVDSRTIGT